ARTTGVRGTTRSPRKAASSSASRSRSGTAPPKPSTACCGTPSLEPDMAWYHEIRSSLAALFGRRRQDAEMDEEMRFHLDMETPRHVGDAMSEREARRL